jgi:outer membrane receptor for ferric coprogen and ferric-rhodotorulic acid
MIEDLSRGAVARRALLSGCALVALAAAPASAQETAEDDDDAAALTLQTIDVLAAGGAATEGTGSYDAEGVLPSATGLPLSARETPQSVSIVTQQELVDQNLQTLNQVVEYTPGLVSTQGNGEYRFAYYARGSSIENQQIDGVSSYVHFYARDVLPQDDMAMYDRVEVVRGATGLLEGTGNPSASVNMVLKRPLAFRQVFGEAGATSYGSGRLVLDASSPLNAEGTVRGRFVASGVAGEGARDNLTDDRGLLYGLVEFDIGDRTTASLGVSHARENIDGYSWGGVWTQVDGVPYDFDGHTSPSLSWEYSHREATTGFVDIEHELDNGWVVRAAGRAVEGNSDMLTSYMRWEMDDLGTPQLLRDGGRYQYVNQGYAMDVQASGQVTLFGRNHDVVFGASGNSDRTRYDGGSYYTFVIDDPAIADPYAEPKPPLGPSVGFWDMTNQQWGVYGAARLNLTDQLKVIAGARATWFDYHETSDYAGALGYSVDGKVVPYLGAVYDIDDTWSVYASYTEIFQPQQSYGVDGLLDPVSGTNYEAGAKAALLDGRLTAAAALFLTDRDGLAEVDPNNSDCGPPSNPTCYMNAGKVRTQGAEVEVSGAVTDRWNLMASLTYATTEYADGENDGEPFEPNVNPKTLVKLGTTYAMGGGFEGLTVGGALRYQSGTYAEGTDWASADLPFRMEQDAYAVVDLMARYDLSERTWLQLNVDNLFDETYYTAFWNPGYGNFIGAPRSAALTLRHTF